MFNAIEVVDPGLDSSAACGTTLELAMFLVCE